MERKPAIIALIAFLFLAISIKALPMELKETATYFAFTGENVAVAWDAVTNAVKYVYRVKSYERNSYINIRGRIENETTETTINFIIPFAGHFIIEVKAMDATGNSSTWAISSNPNHSIINNLPTGWWIYGHIAPPAGNVQIEQQGDN